MSPLMATLIVLPCTLYIIKCMLVGTLYRCESVKIMAENSVRVYSIYGYTLMGIDASEAESVPSQRALSF